MSKHYEVEILGDIEVSHAFYLISRYKAAGYYQYMDLLRILEKENITIKEMIDPRLCVRRFIISRDTRKGREI